MTGVFGFFSILGMVAIVILPIYFYIRTRIKKRVIEELYEFVQMLEDLKDEIAGYEDDTVFDNHEDAWETFKASIPDYKERMQTVIDGLNELSV